MDPIRDASIYHEVVTQPFAPSAIGMPTVREHTYAMRRNKQRSVVIYVRSADCPGLDV